MLQCCVLIFSNVMQRCVIRLFLRQLCHWLSRNFFSEFLVWEMPRALLACGCGKASRVGTDAVIKLNASIAAAHEGGRMSEFGVSGSGSSYSCHRGCSLAVGCTPASAHPSPSLPWPGGTASCSRVERGLQVRSAERSRAL